MSAKLGVIVFPGSNCDHDAYHALAHIMNAETTFLWHKDTDLSDIDFLLIPGGFSYGDYLRSGAIARFSPIMQSVIQFANQGRPVLGICNGFQILLEAGLLPGAMLHNEQLRFVCKHTHIRCETSDTLFTRNIVPGSVLQVPVAHGEGNYTTDQDQLKQLQDNDQIVFRYCNEGGETTDEANFNGSIDNIAGICNTNRNILGMMPHPERAVEKLLGSDDGKQIFESVLEELAVA
ncbi:phosphoribosylformylglycinamidine synthase subunit I [Fodinibius salinus]|uniref:Phosphoribosylformylglycinamidine synthase subunit PurQ n=1 Tax=Fodinibius salinus TaxID=860790 RepID=A0A5D3YJ07_9BACT|nr:phosphoribosylformylglycinamidine synthase subunit PurQ [Fodinibius salinus]TYP93488.1 phosphoribosylformylglycinamidine synthase subunit I [Fodinibius salinus]